MKPALTIKEVATKYSEKFGTPAREAEQIWKNICALLTENLIAGEVIRIKGVGTLVRKDRPAKETRVPGTNKVVTSAPRFGFKIKSKAYDL